jgi:hypothetical protein
VQLQPLYRATFTTPERWAVEVAGTHGTEVQDFLIAEGRTEDASRHVCGDPTIPADAQTAHCFPTFAAPWTPMTAPPSCFPGTATRGPARWTGEKSLAVSPT